MENIEELQVQSNRQNLKIQALKERLAEITVTYEDRDADRRIVITELGQANDQLKARVAELESHFESLEVPETEEPVVDEATQEPA